MSGQPSQSDLAKYGATPEVKELVAKLLDLGVDKQILAVAASRTPQCILNWHSDVRSGAQKRPPGRPRKAVPAEVATS